jgi:alpha/beta superfamily hydrolase
MEITQTTAFVITIDSKQYSFTDPHPIQELLVQNENATLEVASLQRALSMAQSNLDRIEAEIITHCN